MKIALIPARGGSKRIPGKNIKYFCGQSIIAYSINAALESGCFDHVMVSTDSEKIASVAKAEGAEIPFMRPDNIADDYATTMDVIRHTLEWYEGQGHEVEAICCLYATAPFVRAEDIVLGEKTLQETQSSFAFSATEFPFPIQRAFHLDGDKRLHMFEPDHFNTRSQDLTEAYHDAGQFYWCTAEAIRNDLPIFAPHSTPVLLDRSRVQDIDTPADWAFAEALYKIQQS